MQLRNDPRQQFWGVRNDEILDRLFANGETFFNLKKIFRFPGPISRVLIPREVTIIMLLKISNFKKTTLAPVNILFGIPLSW